MLVALAWKNVWRNKKRSLIIVCAIAFGMWGALVAGAVMMGWGESMVTTAIDRDLGHIEVHKPGYARDRDLAAYLPDGARIANKLRAVPGVQAVSARTLVDGTAASPVSTFGVRIEGIVPEEAKAATDISRLIVQGGYFGNKEANAAVIGKKLADRMKVNVRSRIVLGFQGIDGSLVSAAFRVVGIFRSASSRFDETHVFVRQTDLFRLLSSGPIVHEIVIRAETARIVPEVLARVKALLPDLSVKTWKELAPEIALTASAMEGFTYLFIAIILTGLIFGITNTMLMAVMERTRELGVLMALGMGQGAVFSMIVLETVLLSLTGAFLGMCMGWCTIAFLSRTGINLSAFASSLGSFGVAAVLYPYLPALIYAALTVMVVLGATVAAMMPAWKAVRLQPSKAMRTE
jgi:ABC-type lipoprotein release transport system permease subunit